MMNHRVAAVMMAAVDEPERYRRLIELANTLEREVNGDRAFLVSCPWCALKMNDHPIAWQMSHVIGCGEKRIHERHSAVCREAEILRGAVEEIAVNESVAWPHDVARSALEQVKDMLSTMRATDRRNA